MTFRDFEGQPVTESGMELPGAGGGFHNSLAVDGLELSPNDEVDVLSRLRCTKVRFDPIDRDDPAGPLRRVSILQVVNAALDDSAAADDRLAEQAKRVEAARAEAKGELPFGEGGPEGGVCAHDQPADECDLCANQEAMDIDDGPAPDSIPALDRQFDPAANESAEAESHLRAVPD